MNKDVFTPNIILLRVRVGKLLNEVTILNEYVNQEWDEAKTQEVSGVIQTIAALGGSVSGRGRIINDTTTDLADILENIEEEEEQ